MTIVVTGGTKGIGLAIARRLAAPGEIVALGFHRDKAAAAAAVAVIEAGGARALAIQSDVGQIEGAAHLIERATSFGGPLNCLVHSAAMIYPTSLLEADLERFTRAVQTNGLSLLYLVQKAAPLMPRGASVIFISSAGARQASPRYGALGAGKALAESLIRYLAAELAPRGVRINAVAPGLVRTTSVASMVGGEEAAERAFERAAKTNPSGRMSLDEDYTELVAFLAGPGAAFIQGQVIHANGGAFLG
jgi:NAD(P)-dependent dehydrogenase (short-subunit alcohol dehydrogenase family)